MQKIKILEDYKEYKENKIIVVDNNKAASLIQLGVACLKGKVRLYRNKMMTPESVKETKQQRRARQKREKNRYKIK